MRALSNQQASGKATGAVTALARASSSSLNLQTTIARTLFPSQMLWDHYRLGTNEIYFCAVYTRH